MKQKDEMQLLLRGIQRLRWELNQTSIDDSFKEWWDKYSRLNTLLECLNVVCWSIYGDRSDDKGATHEVTKLSFNKEEERAVTGKITRIG